MTKLVTFSACPTDGYQVLLSTAGFRAWGSEISASLAAVGVVKTTDSGQIDWTSVSAPTGGNQVAGYEIWRLNDAMQSAFPVYFKLEYGSVYSNDNAYYNSVAVKLTVGTGANGSGGITGIFYGPNALGSGGGANYVSDTGYRPSFYCCVDGAFWMINKKGASRGNYNNGIFGFGLFRSCDNTGRPTADFVTVVHAYNEDSGGQGNTVACVAPTGAGTIATTAASTNVRAAATTPGIVNARLQAWRWYGAGSAVYYQPLVQPIGTAFNTTNALPDMSQVMATVVGTTPRNYLILNATQATDVPGASAGQASGFIWE